MLWVHATSATNIQNKKKHANRLKVSYAIIIPSSGSFGKLVGICLEMRKTVQNKLGRYLGDMLEYLITAFGDLQYCCKPIERSKGNY